jgi:hypothetical protein
MDMTEWEHEERDSAGALVARYETWLGFDSSGTGTGTAKYGPEGSLLEQKPIPINEMLTAHGNG